MSNKTSRKASQKYSKSTVKVAVSSETQKILWLFDRLDRDGKFAFDINRLDFDHKGFLDKLISYSGMTWAEVRRQTHDDGKSKHHFIEDTDKFSPEAKGRIEKLQLWEDTDSIFSFAFDNLLRIIGIRNGEKFHVVWYDAHHEFYPSPLRHT